jgi:uncharacterized protein
MVSKVSSPNLKDPPRLKKLESKDRRLMKMYKAKVGWAKPQKGEARKTQHKLAKKKLICSNSQLSTI